ncbi:WD40 repeat-like protein [Vararia minispora EC-137]|uniref:WD40 repeat-like protein n=1 Tax=Vararia minispora EC-137 TaxID=1314806 RepID=A0ACB8QLH2_9AGAM|nr:WD40 repeat-like protein [Vararia minispora EC-137]
MFFCAISGEPPQDPVISSKSGHVYERRLILKYISENGTDPITGEKLEEGDLVTVKASPNAPPPRPPTHSSIPALLTALQNEWDAMVLETFTLKQQFNSTRQELSYALYSQDAAVRVVARLMRERDAAREALANVQASMGITPSAPQEDVAMAEDGAAAEPDDLLPPQILEQINETYNTLSASRKKRKVPAGYATPADIKTFKAKHEIPSLHSASPAGVTAIALSVQNPGQFLTGGNDKIVQLYDRNTNKVLANLKGHTKRINRVALRERTGELPLLCSAGADKLARIWSLDSASGEYMARTTIRTHKSEVTGLSVHPTGILLTLGSLDKTFSVHDLNTFAQLYRSPEDTDSYLAHATHPDGTIVAFGTSAGQIKVYDYRTMALAATLAPDADAAYDVRALSFSENGFNLIAPGAGAGTVDVWDLRKQKVAKTLELGDAFAVRDLTYDYSAQLLAIAGFEGVRVHVHKSYEELARFEEGGECVAVAWGQDSKELWGIGGRDVRIWGA